MRHITWEWNITGIDLFLPKLTDLMFMYYLESGLDHISPLKAWTSLHYIHLKTLQMIIPNRREYSCHHNRSTMTFCISNSSPLKSLSAGKSSLCKKTVWLSIRKTHTRSPLQSRRTQPKQFFHLRKQLCSEVERPESREADTSQDFGFVALPSHKINSN